MDSIKSFALEVQYRGQVFYRGIIQNTPISLGRSKDCDIPFEKMDFLSRKHMEIFFKHPHYFFKDLGSSNGIYVDGKKTQEGQVKDSLVLNIGELNLVFKEIVLKPKEGLKTKNNLDKTITEISLHGTLNEAVELEVMFEDMREELGTEPGIELLDITDPSSSDDS